MFTVRPYVPADASAWDASVARSRNGNFLHRRHYMDYHAERFVDQSLVVERDGEVEAVFPANRRDNAVISHAGLTYAGLIASPAMRAEATLAVFETMRDHYRASGVERLIYKAVPYVFHTYHADEDLYALHRLGAQLTRRDISSVVSLRDAYSFTEMRKRSINKATQAGVRVRKGADLAAFHALLSEVLQQHEATPTHSVQELSLLRERFPDSIVLYEAHNEESLLAAALVYDFGGTVHTQYLACSEEGRRLQALSLLLGELIGSIYAERRYFSLGISTEQEGRYLNGGLITQKEHFGARAVAHDFYEWVF